MLATPSPYGLAVSSRFPLSDDGLNDGPRARRNRGSAGSTHDSFRLGHIVGRVVTSEPTTEYARRDGHHVAFQVIGSGPPYLVIVPGLTSHLEIQWEDASYRSFVRRLAKFSAVVRFDKRGTGLSDPVVALPTLDERVADLAAVIAAAGARRPFRLGYSEGGPIAVRFVASTSELVAGLVLYGTSARNPPPWAMARLEAAMGAWGTGASIEVFAPSLAADPGARRARARLERASASPAMARAILGALAISDVRPLLPAIRTPALVVHRTEEFIPIDEARYLAAHIEGADLVEMPGVDHIPWVGDSDAIVGAIERFVTAHARAEPQAQVGEPRPSAPSRPIAGWASLTPKELEVVSLVAAGASNPEIARRLFISRHTVETHVKHIFAKLGVDSRVALAGEALRRNQRTDT